MGLVRNFAAVNYKSWIWQMYCLLAEERRMQTTYQEYETFMLEAVKRLEKCVHEEAQAGRIARIVEVNAEKRVVTSHGPENILIAEVIDVEAKNSTLLGEEDFTLLKFFSRSEDNDLGDEVDDDTDSQREFQLDLLVLCNLRFLARYP